MKALNPNIKINPLLKEEINKVEKKTDFTTPGVSWIDLLAQQLEV